MCLSVTFPNYKMFWGYRCLWPEEQWVILDISPRVVEQKRCVFNPRNAASSEMTQYSEESRTKLVALEGMFYDKEGPAGRLRSSLNLRSNCTTDPQAEIVVTEIIEPIYIEGVYFNCGRSKRNLQSLSEYERTFGTEWVGKFIPDKAAYAPRHDFEYWKR